MPFVPAPNTIMAEMMFTANSQVMENVLHYQPNSSFDFAVQAPLLAQGLLNWWNTNLKAQAPTNVSLARVKLTDLTTQFSPVFEQPTGLPLAGTSGQTLAPMNCTVAIKLITALRGRSYRGRVYHVGMNLTHISQSSITSGAATTFANAYILLLTITNTQSFTLGVLSKISGGVPRGTAIFQPVVGVSVENTIDSQRRRLPGRGR